MNPLDADILFIKPYNTYVASLFTMIGISTFTMQWPMAISIPKLFAKLTYTYIGLYSDSSDSEH